jgi:hypothetical protein
MKKRENKTSTDENIEQARRRLLKLGVYTPPAILGSMLAPVSASAATMVCNGTTYTISATTTACCPCVQNINSWQCRQAQCALGNCKACGNTNFFFSQQDCQNFASGPCANGCTCRRWGRWGWVCR